ncbi:NAD(P)/FAD-dependent oxidoreductase [Candidatus Avelusimicrobium sp.]
MSSHEIGQHWHSIIVGAGAAGLFCAGSFAAPKLVLEHNALPGKKLAVTGGGKCNFTNIYVSASDYVSRQKHFCKSALSAFKPHDFIRLLEEQKIPFYEKEAGQLFAYQAKEIVTLLDKRARRQNTTFSYNTQVLSVAQDKNGFKVQTSKGIFYTENLVIATGGLSYPALGAGGFSAQAARSFNIDVVEQRPALVGLRAPEPVRTICKMLAGNSLTAQVKVGKHLQTGQLLFTHDGFSGPVILQSSLFWQEGEKIFINFLPTINVETFLKENKNSPDLFSKILSSFLPVKFTKNWLAHSDVCAANAKKESLLEAAKKINCFEFIPSGTAGFTRAEVTAGGADCAAFNPSTFEHKKISGLFFIGEALDVAGRLGGYNLHWAWASAHACAKALQKK